jgi:hypothetical protein
VSGPAGLPLATVARGPACGGLEEGPTAATDDMLHRLALWLADVAAEAATAPTLSEASLTPWRAAPRPPRAGSAH